MYEETETWRTNCIYHSHKRIRIRLCQWEDISGESEICLRTRIKLLLLSGCGCILPHRGAAGAFKPEGISDSVCGSGIFLSGSLLGRFVCGWLCPFGLVQDLLYKIPVFRKRKTLPFHHVLKYGKYVVLFLLAGAGSLFLFGGFAKVPAFCKYLCPSGTLFGAVPLLAANEALLSQIGGMFFWKLGILLFIIILSVKVYRPFCQYLCPLGAVYGWFNRFSLVRIQWEEEKCISCMACEKACPVALSLQEISRSPECIRCGQCVESCPVKCLHFTVKNAGTDMG